MNNKIKEVNRIYLVLKKKPWNRIWNQNMEWTPVESIWSNVKRTNILGKKY
jgi:hypothetical protein